MDVSDVALLAIVQWTVTLIGEEVGKSQNSVQRRAQLVAHGGEKLILELACAHRCFFSYDEGFLSVLLHRDVVENDYATPQGAILTAQRSAGDTDQHAVRIFWMAHKDLYRINPFDSDRSCQRRFGGHKGGDRVRLKQTISICPLVRGRVRCTNA